MRKRRFLLLAGVLAALNAALWLAPQGLALRRAVVGQLFGSKMMRAEVVWSNGMDWRLDRGQIVAVNALQIRLREADGRVQAVPLSPATRVLGAGRFPLTRGWQVLVTWPANGSAVTVQVEKRTSTRSHRHPRH